MANAHISIGSADKTIKLWQQHKALHTFTGHTDAVRGLALIPDIGFASCSNDRSAYHVRLPSIATNPFPVKSEFGHSEATMFTRCLDILHSSIVYLFYPAVTLCLRARIGQCAYGKVSVTDAILKSFVTDEPQTANVLRLLYIQPYRYGQYQHYPMATSLADAVMA